MKKMACKSLNNYSDATTFGAVEISCCCQGVHSVHFVKDENVNMNLPHKFSVNDTLLNTPIHKMVSWLNVYFCEPSELETAEKPPVCPSVQPKKGSFTEAVWNAMTEKVKFGKTISYHQLALITGHPRASRAVGNVMRRNPIVIFYPCHRVIKSNGDIGNFSSGQNIKRFLLQHETRNFSSGQNIKRFLSQQETVSNASSVKVM